MDLLLQRDLISHGDFVINRLTNDRIGEVRSLTDRLTPREGNLRPAGRKLTDRTIHLRPLIDRLTPGEGNLRPAGH